MALPNTLYTASIKGHNGKDYTLSIMSDVRTAASTDLSNILADGVTIAWEGGDADDPMYPIVSSTLELSFMADSNLILQDVRDMSVESPFDTFIKMEEDGGDWVWWGHLLPEEVSYEITDGLTEVGLTFVDGLSLLKDIDFKVDAANDFHVNYNEVDGGLYQPCRTGLGHVYGILNKLPWVREHHAAVATSTPMLIETPVLSHTGIDAVQDGGDPDVRDKGGILPTLGINPTIFADEKNNNKRRKETRVVQEQTFANCYDVLADILSTLGYKICWNGYNWHCYSILGHGEDLPYYRYTKGRLNSSTTGRITALYNSTTTPSTSTEDIHQYYELVDGASLSFRPGNGRLTAIHEKAGQRNLIQNKPHYNSNGEMIPPIYHYYDVEYVEDSSGTSVGTYVRSSSDTDTPLQNSKWKMTDETFEFNQDDTLSIRFKARMSYPKFSSDTNKCIRNIPLLAIKLKAGTQSHSADPYYLHGPVAKHPNFVNYDNNSGNAPDKVQYVLDLDDAGFLSDIDWALGSTLTTPAASSLSDGIVYIPLHWQGEAYETDVAYLDADQNPTGQIAYGTAMVEKKMVSGNDRFEYKRNAVMNEVDINLEIPGFPTGLRGYELEIGMAVMDGTVSTNATVYDSLFDTGVNAIDYLLVSGLTTPSTDYFGMQGLAVDHMTVSLGGSSDANAVYHLGENKEANDLTLIDTRVATTPVTGAGGSRLNLHNDWIIESGEIWSYSGQWYNLIDGWSASANYYDNLRVLVEEFGQRFKNGIISVETDLAASDYSQSWDILTPDMRLFSDKMMAGDTTIIADNITWNSTTGMNINGIVADRTRGTLTELIEGGKDLTGDFTNGSTVGYNGSDKPFSNVSEALDDKQDALTGTGVVSVNNDVVSVGNITKGDVTDLQSDLDSKQDSFGDGNVDGSILRWNGSSWSTTTGDTLGTISGNTALSSSNFSEIVAARDGEANLTTKLGAMETVTAGKQDAITGTGIVRVTSDVVSVDTTIAQSEVTNLSTDLSAKVAKTDNISELNDVASTLTKGTPTNAQVLQWKNTGTVPSPNWEFIDASIDLNDIANVSVSDTPPHGSVLLFDKYDAVDNPSGTDTWQRADYFLPFDTGTSGQVLTYPSSGNVLEWADQTGAGGGSGTDDQTLDEVLSEGNSTTRSLTTGNHDINVTSLTDGLTITNTDNTSGVWSAIQLHRNSSSPADEDNICSINFNGEDSSSVATTYAAIQAVSRDVINGTEDGGLLFRAKANNSWTNAIEINGDDSSPTTTINNFPSVSTVLELANAGGTAGLNVRFDADMATTSTNNVGLNYRDATNSDRNFLRVENAKTILNNRTASSTVEIRSNDTVAGATGEFTNATFKAADDGTNGDITTIFGDHQSVALMVNTDTAGSWTGYTNTTAGIGSGNWVLCGAHNSDAVLRTDITGGNVKLVTQDGVFVGNSVTDTGGYTLPGQDGTANQVLQTDGSGNVAWATAGGGNPHYNFDQTCYNSVTTTTDTYYWMPGSTTYGFEFYDNNEKSSLGTTNLYNQYKKMSHRLPSGTYDIDIHMDLAVSSSTTGSSNASDYAGDTVTMYVYKVAHTSSNDASITQIGTDTLTLNASDSSVPVTTTVSLSGQSMSGGDRIMVVLKGSTVASGTRYVHWAYDIDAEKTA